MSHCELLEDVSPSLWFTHVFSSLSVTINHDIIKTQPQNVKP